MIEKISISKKQPQDTTDKIYTIYFLFLTVAVTKAV